jgi:ABC-type multidrug transport system ATPase subunit
VNRVLAVVGPNGAGKSTLHSLLSFAARRTSGAIEYGKDPINLTRLAVVPQENLFWEELTV